MARNSISKRNKNLIQNVRIVDKDEGTDDMKCQRLIQSYNVSEGQIRVVLGFHQELSGYAAGGISTGIISFSDMANTDDFLSFSAQYLEFRVRAIRFDVYDLQPNNTSVVNYWSTYHTVGGTTTADLESTLDRPDARAISPGDGKASLAWVAHSIPEMGFQRVDTFNGLGGLSYYTASATVVNNTKYSIVAKFVVDFRGRR